MVQEPTRYSETLHFTHYMNTFYEEPSALDISNARQRQFTI